MKKGVESSAPFFVPSRLPLRRPFPGPYASGHAPPASSGKNAFLSGAPRLLPVPASSISFTSPPSFPPNLPARQTGTGLPPAKTLLFMRPDDADRSGGAPDGWKPSAAFAHHRSASAGTDMRGFPSGAFTPRALRPCSRTHVLHRKNAPARPPGSRI